MIFDKIVGHEKQIQALRNAQFSQAYLFSGPSGVGKKLVALACAQKILNLTDTQQSHPDLFFLSTDEPTIKIETIRQLQNFVNLKSFNKLGKVVIIDEAHKMNAQAANSLLKTLEEPPEGCHFFLITSQKGTMLSTILSRCQKIGFGALTLEQVKRIAPESPDWALSLCQGRLDMLTKWTDENRKELRKKLFKVLCHIEDSTAGESFSVLDEISQDRENALFSTLLWNHWFKQSLSSALGATTQGNQEEQDLFCKLAKSIKIQTLINLSQKTLELERDIHANVNRRLAFENFWLTLKSSYGNAL